MSATDAPANSLAPFGNQSIDHKICKDKAIMILSQLTAALNRKALALGTLALAGVLVTTLPGPANAANGKDAKIVKAISDHFAGVPTLKGEFIQFGPRGEQTGGKFYLQRPGRIRFDYDKPSPMSVFSDGKTVAINNKKLKTWDFFPLNKTPLRLLLAKKINVDDKAIKSVKAESDLTTVVLGDKSVFGDSKITLMFDPTSFDLRQWTITDDQGKDTSVMIFNVEKNARLSKRLFKINYALIEEQKNRTHDR
ncbi:MAG: outer membrane lipoprotein carrier protein LolA [Pseudomonadota bacterium]